MLLYFKNELCPLQDSVLTSDALLITLIILVLLQVESNSAVILTSIKYSPGDVNSYHVESTPDLIAGLKILSVIVFIIPV